MRILVTGATGRVGRRFVPRLLARAAGSDTVRLLVRDPARAEPLVRLGAEAMTGELREPADVRRALAGAEAVVNLAASFPAPGVPDEELWAVNHEAALALARAALDAGASRFVQAGTGLVYGAGRGRPAAGDGGPVPGTPAWDAYARSKRAAEEGLLALHRAYGLDVRIGRLTYVHGEGGPHPAAALHRAAGRPDRRRTASIRHADVPQGLLRLLYAPGIGGRAYDLADHAPATAVEPYRLSGAGIPAGPWDGVVSAVRVGGAPGPRPRYPWARAVGDAGVR
ncbi:NAD-dependent epimerase/dehydratase family protein [Actinacidiphila sp. ITFR-21]|uniref:NAD-dependent epimerase/dehydratase family protein n=1 Tax=Actinacidiphila sp. ITFR-21 TaxID=3075199 RepID=UPI00288956BF|nr:NAD-dependent epimerase/dehydratase family protein [Streptomyces sp. ITFR-21]WNI14613.1 NAD-dependent epimerase/dehydratase family protein [Streptomyces sp. ITFR-21]